jgi:2-octaprenyl-6-methoxyphenol hydroxylase
VFETSWSALRPEARRDRSRGPPRAWPLGLTLARDFVGRASRWPATPRTASIRSPGQGLNLGFKRRRGAGRDDRRGAPARLDIGALTCWSATSAGAASTRWQMGVTTDVLNRLFSNDFRCCCARIATSGSAWWTGCRAEGQFIREAAGLTGRSPRLLQGEAGKAR